MDDTASDTGSLERFASTGVNALGTTFPKRSARIATLLGWKVFDQPVTQSLSVASRTPVRAPCSKVELQSELDNSRIVACGDDAAEIAGIQHLARCGIDTATRAEKGVQVANRISEIRMIELVEKLSAKFEGPRFG